MNNCFWFIILMLWIGDMGAPILSNPVIENDAIISNALPDWGTICTASDVRGGPDEMYPVIYSVHAGARVRIHGQSRPDGTWVSIGAAEWLPLKNLCK